MNLYRCEQCGLELAADELATVNGHAVPDVDDDGEVCGQTLCGPVRLNDEIAAARITELEAALAAEKRLVADYAKHNAELVAECERLREQLAIYNAHIVTSELPESPKEAE